MPTFFNFKRLSPVGAAILILIMVLMLYPVLPPEPHQAHAATRLGLHVTQEELNIWRQRKNDNSNGINGQTYQSIWDNRIMPDANNFRGQSHPGGDGYWEGWTGSGCYPNTTSLPQPGRGNGQNLLKSAFIFLVTGDASYADPVKSELLNQIAQPGADFGNSNKWCASDFDGNSFDVANWVMLYLHAYDYLTAGGYTGFTSGQKTNIITWFHNAGLYYMGKSDLQITHLLFNGLRNGTPPNYTPDYTCNGWSCPGDTRAPTSWQGFTVRGANDAYTNRATQGTWLGMSAGILANDQSLINRGKLWVQEWLQFSVFADGTPAEMNRWADCPGDCGSGSSWGHMAGNWASEIMMADMLARMGDTSLYTYSTSNGHYGTEGGPKSLQSVLLLMARMVNGTVSRYGTDNGTQNASTRINPFHEGGHAEDWAAMIANIFYQNNEIRTAMNRGDTTGSNCGGVGCYGWPLGTIPDTSFMFGNMDGLVNPYGTGGAPTPTPTPSPSPCTSISYLSSTPSLPTTIEAENYNKCSGGQNGEGTTYHDLDAQNQGGAYRTSEGVDLESSTDTGGGYHISHTAAGEWTTYTVSVPTTGTYTAEFRVASNGTGGTLHLEANNQNLTGAVQIPDTGDWTTWATISKQITLSSGTQTLKLIIDSNGTNSFGAGNINYIKFTSSGGATACSQYTPSTPIPTGYASPYDVVSSPSTNLMNATCLNLTDARLDLGKGDPLQYIYNTGYLFKTGGTNWTPLSYTSSESLIAGAWYPKTATTNLTMTGVTQGR